ncbi:MAG: PAS domain-containing sensor histidine kinase [Vampirovibrio sp.]|nr:PAS domain-containing sensor histidine kinase [Vampirovibrio sp.]
MYQKIEKTLKIQKVVMITSPTKDSGCQCLVLTKDKELLVDYAKQLRSFHLEVKLQHVDYLGKLDDKLSESIHTVVIYDLTTFGLETLSRVRSSLLNDKVTFWVLVEEYFIDQAQYLFSLQIDNIFHKSKYKVFAYAIKQLLERKLHKSPNKETFSQKTRFILNSFENIATDVIWSKDLNGKYDYINQAGATFHRKKIEEIIGEDDKNIFMPDAYQKIKASDIAVINSRLPSDVEFTLNSTHGEKQKYYMAMKAPCFDNDGEVVGLIGIIRDITEKKKLEMELMEAKIQAEEASQKKSEFLSSITHELRTPLCTIITSSDFMLEGVTGELSDKQSSYIYRMNESGKHVLSLIDELLDIAKIESGKYFLNCDKNRIEIIIDQACHLIEPLIQNKNQVLIKKIDPNLPYMYIDRIKIKQALINLLTNAHKFSSEHTQILISAQLSDDNELIISVSDQGSGIPEKDIDRIFLPFEQTRNQNQEYTQGTGLGLPITKNIIDYHKGRILVQSKLGQGSTFIIYLPVFQDVNKLEEESILLTTPPL